MKKNINYDKIMRGVSSEFYEENGKKIEKYTYTDTTNTDFEVYYEDEIKTSVISINDKSECDYVFYKNGQMEARELIMFDEKDDIDISVYESWYENGTKRTIKHQKKGKNNGLYEEWYKNGTQKTKKYYKYGKVDGLYEEWDENGTPKTKKYYKYGIAYDSYEDYKNRKKKIDNLSLGDDSQKANEINKEVTNLVDKVNNSRVSTEFYEENGKKVEKYTCKKVSNEIEVYYVDGKRKKIISTDDETKKIYKFYKNGQVKYKETIQLTGYVSFPKEEKIKPSDSNKELKEEENSDDEFENSNDDNKLSKKEEFTFFQNIINKENEDLKKKLELELKNQILELENKLSKKEEFTFDQNIINKNKKEKEDLKKKLELKKTFDETDNSDDKFDFKKLIEGKKKNVGHKKKEKMCCSVIKTTENKNDLSETTMIGDWN